jgi:hypothetical protein
MKNQHIISAQSQENYLDEDILQKFIKLLNKMKNDNRWKLLEITEENQEKFAAFSS